MCFLNYKQYTFLITREFVYTAYGRIQWYDIATLKLYIYIYIYMYCVSILVTDIHIL